MSLQPERVYTMTDYYDGPRGGIADYHGQPHVYDSLWADPSDCWTDLFMLMPITDDVFQLALQDWGIWKRWQQAFRDGKVNQASFPALPDERGKHDEIVRLLGDQLRVIESRAITVAGRFEYQTSVDTEGNSSRQRMVYWGSATNIPDSITQSSLMLTDTTD